MSKQKDLYIVMQEGADLPLKDAQMTLQSCNHNNDDREFRIAHVREVDPARDAIFDEVFETFKAIMFNNADLTTGVEWAEKRQRALDAIARAEGSKS